VAGGGIVAKMRNRKHETNIWPWKNDLVSATWFNQFLINKKKHYLIKHIIEIEEGKWYLEIVYAKSK